MRPTDRSYSPEMETLDQLLGGDQTLSVIRRVFASDQSFVQGVSALLRNGDVVLLAEGAVVPEWKVQALFRDAEVLNSLNDHVLRLTDQGAEKIA